MELEQIFQKGAFKLLFRTVFNNGITRRAAMPFIEKKIWQHIVENNEFWQIETERTQQLLAEWLNKEKERPPFTIIEKESWQTTQFAGLSFHLRADRVDQLADGSLMILDYKTNRQYNNTAKN